MPFLYTIHDYVPAVFYGGDGTSCSWDMLSSYGDMLENTFDNEYLRTQIFRSILNHQLAETHQNINEKPLLKLTENIYSLTCSEL